VLTAEEFEAAAAYYNLRAVGDMHHNPLKNVLHVPARDAKVDGNVLASAKQKLYAARLKRNTPYVDKTIYTGWNGMCISAYLAAGRGLGLKGPVAFGLKSLDRVLASAWRGDGGLAHVVAYGEGSSEQTISGTLDDYALLANATLDGWEASAEMRYFDTAKGITDAMLTRFYDVTGCGFFDTEFRADAIGALSTRRKPLQDSPTPAGNAVAATVLLRMASLTDEASGSTNYETRAQETLETFAGIVEHFGLYAASYGLALRRAIGPPVQVCVIGEDTLAQELTLTSMHRFSVNKSVVCLKTPHQPLPPALAMTVPHLPKSDASVAIVCQRNTCLPPISSSDALIAALSSTKAGVQAD
jgi:uncharacterized protein YyaL (SSP411 family)